MNLPGGKVLVPISKVGKLETDGKPWKGTEGITALQRRGNDWCRLNDDDLRLWKAPGRAGELYLLWPGAAASASRLQLVLQKKAVLTADGKNFGFCSTGIESASMTPGVQYD